MLVDESLPHGFLSPNLYSKTDFDRVPFAFGFQTINGKLDFVIMSVHLNSDTSVQTRSHELSNISEWIDQNNGTEKDFLVAGDFNFQSEGETRLILPGGFVSLNISGCNTNLGKDGHPFDNVVFRESGGSSSIDLDFGLQILDLLQFVEKGKLVEKLCEGDNPEYPAGFLNDYSDHNLIQFRLIVPESDDD